MTFSNIDIQNNVFGDEIDLSGWSFGTGLSLGYFPLAGAIVTESGELPSVLQSTITFDDNMLQEKIVNVDQQSEDYLIEPQECILPIPQIEGKCTINLTDVDQWNNLHSNIDTANNQVIEWSVPNVFSESSSNTEKNDPFTNSDISLDQSIKNDNADLFLSSSINNDSIDPFLDSGENTCSVDYYRTDQEDYQDQNQENYHPGQEDSHDGQEETFHNGDDGGIPCQ